MIQLHYFVLSNSSVIKTVYLIISFLRLYPKETLAYTYKYFCCTVIYNSEGVKTTFPSMEK